MGVRELMRERVSITEMEGERRRSYQWHFPVSAVLLGALTAAS